MNFLYDLYYLLKILMLYYRGKSRAIDSNVEASMHLLTPIEIVPFNQNRFDIVTFIEFADALTNDYICSYFSNTYYQIEIYAHNANLQDNSVSFIMKINKNYSDIKVYIQDAIHDMTIGKKDDVPCIILQTNSIQPNQFNLFTNTDYNWNKKLGRKSSVLFHFGNFVAKKNTNSPVFLKNAFSCFLNIRTKSRNKTPFAGYANMDALIKNLPGYVYYQYQDAPKDLPEHIFNSSLVTVADKPRIITSFLWLLPYARSIFKSIHFMEIDASFKACKPFKYCIFHGIFYNVSIPFALSFAPEESTQLYEMLFTGCKKHGLNHDIFEGINVLSDMGTSIKAFCELHNMPKNFCHRHMIESLGARSSFGIWCARLLKCKNHEDYLKQREFIISELHEYETTIQKLIEEKLKENKVLTPTDNKIQEKILHLKIMLFDPDYDDAEKAPISEITKSNYYLHRWAIWIRKVKHIPRCSNHIEGSHGNINQALPSSGRKSLKVGLSTIAHYIISHVNLLPDTYGDSFQNRHSKFMKKIYNILMEQKEDSYVKCFNEKCTCGESEYVELIYGVKFPCVHTCMCKFALDPNLKFLLKCFTESENLPTPKEFFIDLLNIFPHKEFNLSNFDKQNVIKCVKQIKKKNETLYPNFNEYLASNIAANFLSCFYYTLPPLIEIDTKYTFNHIEKEYDKKEYTFTENNNDEEEEDDNDPIKNRLKLRDEVHGFNFNNSNNEIARLIKVKFEETINEILTLYPELENNSSLSCFEIFIDDYMPIINLNDDSTNIVDLLSSFKIKCWKRADEVTKKHAFFPFQD